MSSLGGHTSTVAKQQSNNSSPDLVRHKCDVTKEEEITLLGLKKSWYWCHDWRFSEMSKIAKIKFEECRRFVEIENFKTAEVKKVYFLL